MRRLALVLVALLLLGALPVSGGSMTIEERFAALEAENRALRDGLRVLGENQRTIATEVARSRKFRDAGQWDDLVRRLDPGPLTGAIRHRRGAPERLPDLGSPLLARLRDDPVLPGLTAGRVDPWDGYANALADPAFELFYGPGALTTSYADHGPHWEAKYVLNSGTVATTRLISRSATRGDPALGSLSSAVAAINLDFGTSAADMTVYLRTKEPLQFISGVGIEPSWLMGSVRAWATIVDNVTITARMEIVDASDVVVAEGDDADLAALIDPIEQSRLDVGLEGPVLGTDYHWRLRVDMTKTAGSTGQGIAVLAEPLLAGSNGGSVPGYTPAVGAWYPGAPGRQLVTIPFALLNITAGATTPLQISDNALGIGSPYIRAPWGGSIVGLSYRLSAAVGAGTLRLDATRSGSGVWTAFSAAALGASNHATQAPGTDTFGATQPLGIDAVASPGITAGLDIAALLWVLIDYDGT